MEVLKRFGRWYWFHFKRGVLTPRLTKPLPEYFQCVGSFIIIILVHYALVMGLIVLALLEALIEDLFILVME